MQLLMVTCCPFQQILRVLYKTYVNLGRNPVWNDLNPKAVNRDELFGFIHHATREWKDGKQKTVYFKLCDLNLSQQMA